MIIEGHDLIDKYRRLRILYNRTKIYSDRPFYYRYWTKHIYQTNLGPRTFVCTTVNKDTEDEYITTRITIKKEMVGTMFYLFTKNGRRYLPRCYLAVTKNCRTVVSH